MMPALARASGEPNGPLPLPQSGGRGRSWLTMGLYQLLFLLLLLVYSPVIVWRGLTDRRYRARFFERTGRVPPLGAGREVVWIHGVSVGEVKAASNFVAELRQRRPDLQLVISSTTPNGHLIAQKEYPDLPVVFYPLDFGRCPARAIDRIRPRCVLLMELEIWPNFLQAASRRRIPVGVINGRISERTLRGYRRARGLLPQLDLIHIYCVQDRAYQTRLLELGVAGERVHVTGNMKYDSVVMGRHEAAAASLRPWLSPDGRPVLVAGSTHADEEVAVLEAVAAVRRQRGADVRTVLVPRHPERAASICEQVATAGAEPVRWSEVAASRPPLSASAVVVVDTIGQLQGFYAACDVAFVGGSLIPHGGQNMLEPAAQGRATIFGPHTANFRRDVELLLAADAVVQVADRAAFAAELGRLLVDREARAVLGERAQRVIADNQGATARTLDLLQDTLGAAPAAAPPPRR
ncbi:MAG: 3-deoxy-D-manno-octulosonic acid transferase [Planctomycetes bacterium]|nr:3-deoxy-D-manno-octulosonic acid transferase [Planctomycetota bacterium]